MRRSPISLAPAQRAAWPVQRRFSHLRPVDPARRNGTPLYEVNNRGNIAIPPAQRGVAQQRSDLDGGAGNGPVSGLYALVGLAADVAVMAIIGCAAGAVAMQDGAPITGKVAYDLIVNVPDRARFTGMLPSARWSGRLTPR